MVDLTIILPTKNSEKYIRFFLDSLKNQDYQNFELFVADSDSKDNTIEIIKVEKDKNIMITCFELKRN